MRIPAKRRSPVVALLLFGAARLVVAAQGEHRITEQQAKEYQVKAAFLYNFTKFVEWRGTSLSRPDDSVTICLAGQAARVRVITETLNARKGLTVRVIRTGDEPKGCAVFFQTSGERPFREHWPELAKAGALVVTEDPAQLNRGSILNFYLADGKVRFEANLDGAKASGFRLNSQLLQLARIAKTEGGRE
jgi:hypothetical protein